MIGNDLVSWEGDGWHLAGLARLKTHACNETLDSMMERVNGIMFSISSSPFLSSPLLSRPGLDVCNDETHINSGHNLHQRFHTLQSVFVPTQCYVSSSPALCDIPAQELNLPFQFRLARPIV